MKFFYLLREKNVFAILVLLNAIPLFCTYYFPTLDGPAHLYNAQLIQELYVEKSMVVSHFYSLTHELLPNWTGHFLLAFFHLFLPAFATEKIMLLLIVLGLPISFRFLLKSSSSQHIANSYLIFPFTYSVILYLGFFNFLLGLIFCFIAIGYWNLTLKKRLSAQRILLLSLLFLLTYLSHLFAFFCLLLVIGVHLLQVLLVNTSDGIREKRKEWSKRLLCLLLCSSIPFFLLFFYLSNRNSGKVYSFLPKTELLQMLYKMTSLTTFDVGKEGMYTTALFVLFLLLFARVLVQRFKKRREQKSLRSSDKWLIISLLFLLFLFILPNANGSSSFYSLRFSFLFFIFLALWIAQQNIGKKLYYVVFSVVMIIHIQLTVFHAVRSVQMGRNATLCEQASRFIPKNSIVLPLNFHANWLFKHLSNYVGAEKPLIILDNYEATTDYFPVRWRSDLPDFYIGDQAISNFSSLDFIAQNHKGKRLVDFVLVLHSEDRKLSTEELKLMNVVAQNYSFVYKNNLLDLYRKKDLRME